MAIYLNGSSVNPSTVHFNGTDCQRVIYRHNGIDTVVWNKNLIVYADIDGTIGAWAGPSERNALAMVTPDGSSTFTGSQNATFVGVEYDGIINSDDIDEIQVSNLTITCDRQGGGVVALQNCEQDSEIRSRFQQASICTSDPGDNETFWIPAKSSISFAQNPFPSTLPGSAYFGPSRNFVYANESIISSTYGGKVDGNQNSSLMAWNNSTWLRNWCTEHGGAFGGCLVYSVTANYKIVSNGNHLKWRFKYKVGDQIFVSPWYNKLGGNGNVITCTPLN